MFDLLKLLADGEFHSGSDLGVSLGISRAAVWKRMKRVTQELGVPVSSVQGKGYRLEQGLQLLNRECLQDAFPSLPIFIYESIGSTNEQAKALLAEHNAPMVVLAEHQTHGRGRRGRDWSSPFAQNLYLSYVWPISKGLSQIDGLSLVIGLAVSKAISRLTGLSAELKWPNDVLIKHKKVAGILLELIGDPVELCHVIIGVGVNLNMLDALDSIDQEWTSLSKELGSTVDRELFARLLIEELGSYLDKQKNHGFLSMRGEWLALHAWQNRNVLLSTGTSSVSGTLIGVGEKGEVCLSVDGQERSYIGGELSLRLSDDS